MKCNKCGAKLIENDIFCPECGAKVEEKKHKEIKETHHKTESKNWVWIVFAVIILFVLIFILFVVVSYYLDACKNPYIRVGKDCCLDKNNNNICDKDESTTNPPPVIPDDRPPSYKCLFGPGIGDCITHISSPNSIILTLRNGFGESISLSSVKSTSCTLIPSYTEIWNAGETNTIVLNGCSYNIGDKTNEEVTITYRKIGSQLDHLISGKVEVEVTIPPDNMEPDKCLFGVGIGTCTDFKATPTTITLKLINSFGETLSISNVKSSNCKGVHSYNTIWNPGDESTIVLNGCSYNQGDKTNEEVTIEYSKSSGTLTHTISGIVKVSTQ